MESEINNIQNELENRILEELHELIFHSKSVEKSLKVLNNVKTILIWDWNKTRYYRNRSIVKLEDIFLKINQTSVYIVEQLSYESFSLSVQIMEYLVKLENWKVI